MSLVETVMDIAKEQAQELAKTIEGELRAECPKQTGTTAKTFHITPGSSDFVIRIGSTAESAYYADQGSGATSRYVEFSPYGGVNMAKRPYSKGVVYSHGRKGWYYPDRQGFVKRVADRHR